MTNRGGGVYLRICSFTYNPTPMAKKDLKKTEHASERHEIAEDIVAIRNLKSFSQEKKRIITNRINGIQIFLFIFTIKQFER